MKYVDIPLYPSAYYSYTVSLEGQAYTITIRWNNRDQSWFMDLVGDDNTPLLNGVKIIPDFPITQDYPIDGLSGFFYLESKSDIDSAQYINSPRLLHQYFNFFYVY